MRALVLGGNGFIGSHVVDELVSGGHYVRVLDRALEKYRSPLRRVDYRLCTFDDSFSVAEALEGIDTVFHLISTTVPGTSNLDPVADIETNMVSSVRLLEHMVQRGVMRIVFLSSGGTVYGQPVTTPVTEADSLAPICSYGVVKVAIENYLFMYQQLHGLQPVIIRASNAYGPREGHVGVQGVVAAFLHKLAHNEELCVWGDGTIVRDYIYVSDLARLCVTAGASQVSGVFNAGSGMGHSIRQIIDVIAKVTGRTLDVSWGARRKFDVQEIVLDISKARAAFVWSPQTSLADGVEAHWNWLSQQIGAA